MEELIVFAFTFLLVYTVYYFLSIRKAKTNKKKLPIEVQYLLLRYKIDLKKIKYRNFLNTIAIVGSLDIALVVTLIGKFENIIWQLLFGCVFLVPIIILSFMAIGNYYQNLQLKIEAESKEKNSKDKKVIKQNKTKKGAKKND